MQHLFSKIHLFILNTFFPIKCINCNKEGLWICHRCFNEIHINTEHICAICQKNITLDGKICLACKRKCFLDGMIWATDYSDPLISKAIHYFKYRFIEELHKPLGDIITKSIKQTELPIPDLIIPVPLHPRRLRWRGFNQSFLLSQAVAQNLLPLSEIQTNENILTRKRYTKPQMKIKHRKDRQQNISGAFTVKNLKLIKNKTILLIDDVSTTGSTVFECAKTLKISGAKEIYAAVVAKEEKDRS